MKLKFRLPQYKKGKWRQSIFKAAKKAQREGGIQYRPEDKLIINVKLYLDKNAVLFHDLDNRLKDIMDSLQGRFGGPKRNKTAKPVIPNDNQIYAVSIEKTRPYGQSKNRGHILIKKIR